MVAIRVPTLELKEDALALLLPTVLPPHGPPAAEQAMPAIPLLLEESLSRDVSGYCANGFGQDRCEGRDPSRTHSPLGCALGSRLPPRLEEEDGEARDRDEELEQPLAAGLTRDSYAGDGDYQTSETWLSLRLQLYSECQPPALAAGSGLPPPTLGGSIRREDPQESPGMAGHWVPLGSVKLSASEEEEDGGQLAHALQPLHARGTEPQPGDSTAQQGDSEQAAPGVPLRSPCQLPRLPPTTLPAAAFSGYELRPPVGAEP